ncbi:hypothetical protein [Kaistella jeonii]|uniref:Uncharacterized protein n=1 Tax=Kaistella jeonii TaxID=266749 RepID=A0A0C1D7W0_9FLAO|nr:hypothetical protein [Kaistella jeonii]KIA89975.1 hypothetical protein OA86_05070 [Kaistella jeonii]SFB79992.1 hypothetical protein SAMN05421876_102280 [Kaistella jeonii]VEI96233.1 Uncharacterised protein [Kaistella jeonii]
MEITAELTGFMRSAVFLVKVNIFLGSFFRLPFPLFFAKALANAKKMSFTQAGLQISLLSKFANNKTIYF